MPRERPYYYVDHGDGARPAEAREWSEWWEASCDDPQHPRFVGKTEVSGVTVSTICLGLDHNFAFKGPPVLYETMTFGGKTHPDDSHVQLRWSTRQEALAGHERTVRYVEAVSRWVKKGMAGDAPELDYFLMPGEPAPAEE